MRSNPSRRARGKGGEGVSAPAEPRANLYDEVTASIIAELEAGRFPWVQPWGRAGAAGPGLPRNALTGRRYSGVNILMLWGAVIARGYPSQGWLTFKQALAAGGCVRKGERGTTVVYADRFTPDAEKARARETGEDARVVPFLKRFTVFNLAQCEGLDGLAPEPAPLPGREIVPAAERLIAATGADFRIGGDKAFYVPSADFIQVPPQPAFRDQINYYRTCFHELTHWTGHPSRLARDLSGRMGSHPYAREELVAEMGSAFVCAGNSVIPTVRHADYLAAWLEVLREDNRAIFRAASQASKAADFLLAFDGPPENEAVPAAAPLASQPSHERIAA
ncbi:MAG: antirestriction protein ArdC [Sphingomonas sp.]|nr:MAG: antirestriction protein ArdC [Sphingomonas sp.]